MAAKDRFSQAGEAVRAAQRNRYLQRLVEDDQLRANLAAAYGAARNAYGRVPRFTIACVPVERSIHALGGDATMGC